MSASPDLLSAIGGGVILPRERKGMEEEETGKGEKSKGRGVEGLPPLYLNSGYGSGIKLVKLSTLNA